MSYYCTELNDLRETTIGTEHFLQEKKCLSFMSLGQAQSYILLDFRFLYKNDSQEKLNYRIVDIDKEKNMFS